MSEFDNAAAEIVTAINALDETAQKIATAIAGLPSSTPTEDQQRAIDAYTTVRNGIAIGRSGTRSGVSEELPAGTVRDTDRLLAWTTDNGSTIDVIVRNPHLGDTEEQRKWREAFRHGTPPNEVKSVTVVVKHYIPKALDDESLDLVLSCRPQGASSDGGEVGVGTEPGRCATEPPPPQALEQGLPVTVVIEETLPGPTVWETTLQTSLVVL